MGRNFLLIWKTEVKAAEFTYWLIFYVKGYSKLRKSAVSARMVSICLSKWPPSTSPNGADPMRQNGDRLRIILSKYKWRLFPCQNGRHPRVKIALTLCQNGERLRIILSKYKWRLSPFQNGRRPQVKMALSQWQNSDCLRITLIRI
jgi:hypothetical protein